VVAIPWLCLLALEALLRLFGYGVSMDFVLRQDVAGESRYLSNPRFTWRFFEPAAARLLPPFSLAARKPSGTCRVFVLGSSAAQGDPEPGFGIARMLDVLLHDRYQGVDFEVVNSSATAINSHVVHAMARAALGLEPDLLVVYSGNNEVVGPFGAGTVLTSQVPSLTLLRAGATLRATRLGQLTRSAVGSVGGLLGRREPQRGWDGMEMFVERQVRRADPALERTYGHYRRNLLDIAHVARRAGVPLVLSTVAVNLRDCGPFGSQHADGLTASDRARWEEVFAEAVRLQEEERWAEAAAKLGAAAEIDAEFAELRFRQGRNAWSLGRPAEARAHLVEARDLDTLRFRADTRINEIVRQVAASAQAARLVDAEAELERKAPDGIPGGETFLDHVHPTFTGNYRLSLALLEGIEAVLPDWVRRRASRRPVLSEPDCARRLVFTGLDRYLLAETMLKRIERPPFTAQPDHAEHLRRFTEEKETLRARGEAGVDEALRQYQDALADPGVDFRVRERYATIEGRAGNQEVAEREWRLLAGLFPQYPSFPLQLAHTLRDASRYAEAESALQKVLEYRPDDAPMLVELASLVHRQGRTADAIAQLERALQLEPGLADAHESLGLLYRALNRRDKAIHHLEAALASDPRRERARKALDEIRGL
jgi:tetratricopeptide (TPR) repeat protein